MKFTTFAASVIAVALPVQSALAQATMNVPVGGTSPAPVPQTPPADPEDTPEEIAKDAARDLKDNRFYNKPGATRAQYDADWQECRLIARGSRTPSGSVPYYYNPAVVSPLAAGVGGALGGLLASAIAEGQQRRANRRNCLLIRGWRLVEVPAAEKARIAVMTPADRDAYFNTVVGAATVAGEVTERTSFEQLADPALALSAPLAGPASLFLGKKVDAAQPVALGPNEAAVVLAFRRPGGSAAEGRSGIVQFARYDLQARDLVYQPRDWKKKGDKTTYNLSMASSNRKASYEIQVVKVTAGSYVLNGMGVGPGAAVVSSNCFGAPTFTIGAGEVAYLGDFLPYMGQKLGNGTSLVGMVYASNPEDARAGLATQQPQLAGAMKPATFQNRATYACSAITMDRWDMPGAQPLADPVPATTTASAES